MILLSSFFMILARKNDAFRVRCPRFLVHSVIKCECRADEAVDAGTGSSLDDRCQNVNPDENTDRYRERDVQIRDAARRRAEFGGEIRSLFWFIPESFAMEWVLLNPERLDVKIKQTNVICLSGFRNLQDPTGSCCGLRLRGYFARLPPLPEK